MNKLFLILALSLIAPMCQAAPKHSKKRVTFASEPQVRTFRKEDPASKVAEQKAPVIAPRPARSVQSRVGDGFLGLAMIWAGIYAIPTAIKHPGDNSFFRAVSIGAFVSGVIITIAGFKKIEHAIRG